MAKNGGIRIDPKLLALSSGQSGQTSNSARLNAALARQEQAQSAFQNQDWDPVLRPVQHIFNVLSAGGSGVMNAIDKAAAAGIAAPNPIAGGFAGVAAGIGGGVNGFFASLNNDPNSENYMTGSKLVESLTDRTGKAKNPNYKDVPDNADPKMKATIGFLGDVFLDPLTYVPGGIFASAARGLRYGAKAAEGLGKIAGAAKGAVQGVPDAVKLGRFTNTVKPIGLKNWKEVRDYEKLGKLQRKTGISEDMLFAITAPNGVSRFLNEVLPQLRKDNGEDYLAELTPKRVQEIADAAEPRLQNYEKVATGAEGARAVAKNEAPSTGAASYMYGDINGVKTPPVVMRTSTKERANAIRETLASKRALTETEIRKLDTENALNVSAKEIDGLMVEREGIVKTLAQADKRARKSDNAAQAALRESETVALTARVAEIDRSIAAANRTIANQSKLLEKYQQEWQTNADSLGIPPTVKSLAEHIQQTQAYLTETGIDHGGIIGLATPAHKELWKIDAEHGLTQGATQTLTASLKAALTPDANGVAALDDMIIGSTAGIPFGLKDAIEAIYGNGSAAINAIPESPAKDSMLEFYSGIIDGVLHNIWDISRNSYYKATEVAAQTAIKAGMFKDLAQEAATYSARTGLLNTQDLIHGSQTRLDALNALPASEREMNAEEVKRLTAVIRQGEDYVRYIESGGPDELTPFIFTGAIEAAAEAARTAGFMAGKAGPKEAVVILQNLDIVKKAITKLNAESPAIESANGSVSLLLGKLIEAHSAMDDSVKTIAAITGDSQNPIKALIDMVTGMWRPSADMISDPDSFGKLIIELAKLPIEIPGVSDMARVRARAFADAEGLGVYGLSQELENYAVGAYGREMLRNFQSTGGIVDDTAGVVDTVADIVSRQEVPGEVFSPREGSTGFGLGADTLSGVEGDGPLGALDLFGNIVARGNNEDELLKNLEIYRSTRLNQIASAYTTNVEAAIFGRKAHFSGEPVEKFVTWWDGEIKQFTTPAPSANIFQVPVDQPIRGKGAAGNRRRVIHNSEKELDTLGTRLFSAETPVKLQRGGDVPGDKMRADSVPTQTPQKLEYPEYYEGKKNLPQLKNGTPEIDAKFKELNPYTTATVSPAEHILGYAKAPLDIHDWVRTIQIAATGTKYSGNFYGRYRAVANQLKIPYGEKTFIVDEAPRSLITHIKDANVINAYNKYVSEFDRFVNKEADASVEIKVSEWKKSKGQEALDKKDFNELRTIASENYGVDPLGRTIRGERKQKKPDLTPEDARWKDYGWLKKFPGNDALIKRIISGAKSEKEALAALQNSLSEGDAALVIPLAINTWGKNGTYGYTPESAKAIIDIRQSIAGSAVGIRAALEEMLPAITVTREYEKSLETAIKEAQIALADAGSKRWTRTETMEIKYVPIGQRVNMPAAAEMGKLDSPWGRAIQNMDITPKGTLPRNKSKAPKDEAISAMPDKQVEEIRDWATGGVKERTIKFDNENVMFNSFDDVAVQELKTALGLGLDEADALIRAAAVRAKYLTEIAPDGTQRLKVTPQQYSEQILAAVAGKAKELDAAMPKTITSEGLNKLNKQIKMQEEMQGGLNDMGQPLSLVIYNPEFRDLLEKVLEIAPYHAMKLDARGAYIYGTSKYIDQAAKSTKPVATFAGFLKSIDAIKERHYGAPNSGMVERLNGAEEAARLLQIDSSGHSNLIAESVNAKTVRQFFSKAESDIIAATKPIGEETVTFSKEITERSATVSPEQQLGELAMDTAMAKAEALKGTTQPLANALEARMRETIRKSIAKAAGGKAAKYGSFGNDTARTATHDVLQELDRAARVLGASPEEIANIKHYALMVYREEAHKLGLNPVTGIAGNNVGRIKYNINKDVDWMFTGYSDVITALRNAGKGGTVTRMLSEIMPETGKIIRGVETGLIFPPNVISEMGVLSVKLNAAGIAPGDVQATIYHALIASIESMPKGYFKEILDGVTFAAPSGANAARLAEYSAALADPRFATLLKEAHVLNGAYAYKAADEISARISERALNNIAAVRTGAQYGLDDIVQTIISSTPEIRSAIEAQGFAADSLVAHLAKGKVQQALNGTFTPTEMGVARTSARTRQAAKRVAPDGSNYRQVMSTELANLASQRIKLANELAAQNAVIRINELIAEATPESIQAAYETGIAALESSMAGSVALANFFLGGPAFAGLEKTYAREQERITQGITDASLRRQAAEQDLKTLGEARESAETARLLVMRQDIVSTIESSTSAAKLKRERLFKIDNELERLKQLMEDIAPERPRYDTSTLASDVPRETMSSFADTSARAKTGQLLSGPAYKEDVFIAKAARETAIDNNINNWESQAEDLTMNVLRFFGVDVKRIPKNGLTDPKLAEQSKSALTWGNDLMLRLFVKGEALEKVLKGIKSPEMRAMTTEFYRLYKYLFDPSGEIWQRAGLDSKWVNQFITQGPLGDTAYAQFKGSLNGHEMHRDLIFSIEKLLEKPTGKGGADWLTIGKGYSWAFQRASMVPTLAAEYSARFGNKAQGLSHAQALAEGWKAISKEGTLAQFLDSEQLYPPYYLRQLANMEIAFNANPNFTGGFAKIVKGIDKATGAIKSSITLWRLGHHVVSVMGEALMNVLAGVKNPVRYAQAWRTMRAADEFGPGSIFGRNSTIPLDDFTNSYKLEAFTGSNGKEGIRIRVAGKERVIPFDEMYKMLDQKGILLNNNTAEDIIVQSDNLLGSQNRMSGILGDLQRANEGLGAFSARRDNLFRIAHAIDIAVKKPHRSVPAMIDDITREVMEYHPTMQMLSPFERKYMRRAVFFYTWQRNAISVILRTMLENPANFTIAPKFIYETSVALGGEPQSIGQPMPNDPRLAGFAAANGLGPHWIDEAGKVQGISINAPQLDIFNTLMGGLYYDPSQNITSNIWRNLGSIVRENTIGQATPAINIPIEILMQSRYSEGGPIPITDYGDYLLDKTGLGYISRATGVGLINNQGFLGPRSDAKTDEERRRYGENALTGLRYTEWSKWYETAQRERSARSKVAQDELAKKLGIMP